MQLSQIANYQHKDMNKTKHRNLKNRNKNKTITNIEIATTASTNHAAEQDSQLHSYNKYKH